MMPSKYAIAEYWGKQPYFEGHPFPDLGEPSCFACGYYNPRWDAPKDFEARWQLARLERAHIIARSAGGSEDPSNLVLLCKQCHNDAPMVNDPKMLFLWMSKRGNWWIEDIKRTKRDAERFGFTAERLRKTGPVDHDLIARIARDLEVGIHFSDEDGGRVSDGSVLAVLGRYLDIKEGNAPEPPPVEEPEPDDSSEDDEIEEPVRVQECNRIQHAIFPADRCEVCSVEMRQAVAVLRRYGFEG